MTWPSFINAALLGGFAALAVPVLIHLLLKTKQRRMKFSTLRFFDFLDEETIRRRKLRHWFLLLLRLLLLALLVAAFARPFLGDQSAAGSSNQPQQALFILDQSISMQAVDGEGRRWDNAIAAMKRQIVALPQNSRVAVIGNEAQTDLLVEPCPPQSALKMLDAIKPSSGSSDLAEALPIANRLIESAGSRFTNIVYVVGDLQKSACRNISSAALVKQAGLKVLNCGDVMAPNLALSDFQIFTGNSKTSSVAVANFTGEDADAVRIRVYIDDKEVMVTEAFLHDGTVTNLPVILPKLAPGWHSATARLESKDSLVADNERQQAFYVAPPLSVWVTESRSSVKVYQEESFFLIAALDPTFGEPAASNPMFAVQKLNPAELSGRLGLKGGQPPCSVVILPGLKQVPGGLSDSLRTFVQAGGGLMLFLGDAVSANHYNAELKDILPATLGASETSTELDWRLWEYDKKSPVFSPFRLPNSGNFAASKFTWRRRLEQSSGSEVLARFQDGTPMIVEKSMGKGRILLVNTSADPVWGDWQKHKTFVPWLHCSVRHLSGRTDAEDFSGTNSWLAGSVSSMPLGQGQAKARLLLFGPTTEKREVVCDAQGEVLDLDIKKTGLYSLRTTQGAELKRFAVNIPAVEADLAAYTPQAFQEQIHREDAPERLSAAGFFLGMTANQREFWRILLLLALIVMVTETILSNRTIP